MVTGGYNNYAHLSSTELLLPGASSWRLSGELPSARSGLRAVTLDNKIVVSGNCQLSYYEYTNLYVGGYGYNFGDDYLNQILEFDQESGIWQPFGSGDVKMKMTRSSHAMTVVNFNQITMYCN